MRICALPGSIAALPVFARRSGEGLSLFPVAWLRTGLLLSAVTLGARGVVAAEIHWPEILEEVGHGCFFTVGDDENGAPL